jgi:hypothetical protein
MPIVKVIYCNLGFGLVTKVKATLKVQLKTNPWFNSKIKHAKMLKGNMRFGKSKGALKQKKI